MASSARDSGLHDTALHDRVRDVRTPGDPPTLSTGTAAELADLMARLHRSAAAGDRSATLVLGWLGKGMDLSQVAAGWLLDPLAHHEPPIAACGWSTRPAPTPGSGPRSVCLTGPAAAIAYAVIANWDAVRADRS